MIKVSVSGQCIKFNLAYQTTSNCYKSIIGNYAFNFAEEESIGGRVEDPAITLNKQFKQRMEDIDSRSQGDLKMTREMFNGITNAFDEILLARMRLRRKHMKSP